MKENNKPIGIFDSGLGGLTVLKALKEKMPKESYVYFGDTAHLPYGNKSDQSIIHYSKQISKFLSLQNIKSLIIACNTASAIAYQFLEKSLNIPVFNVIDPCVLEALRQTKTGQIAIIGTEATVNAQAYQKKIKSINANIKVIAKACPLFVPIVEENLNNEKFTFDISQFYLKEIIRSKTDVIILGCTHYPILINTIRKTVGLKIKIINSSTIAAEHIYAELLKTRLLNLEEPKTQDKFYVSDKSQQFNQLAKIFLKKEFIKAKQIIL